jgi:drug/metabolite transporter (DMT)-like permease
MAAITHDTLPSPALASGRRLASGLGFAAVSAVSFGLSGALARGLLDTGWSPGAVVLVRLGLAALVVLPLGCLSLRGRWGLLRSNAVTVVLYGLLAMAGAQFCYFSAVSRMQVGPALMIEYTGPAAVVLWLWLRHGQRPGAVTLGGAALAAVGLVLVLDVLSGADLDLVGVLWALGAMVGLASFFLISADEESGVPPLALAAGGLVVGTLVLGLLAAVGLLPLHASTAHATYAGRSVAPWIPLVTLALVTAALAVVTGIGASRRLGSRLASFVGLTEVLAGVGWAWLLLGELPRPAQLLGGLLVLTGVVGVKLGEATVDTRPPEAARP